VVIAVLFALLAALLYAVASVLQQRAAVSTPHEHSLRIGLLAKLAVNPIWLIGILADVGGYVCQFVALGHGALALVQPLLVSGLLFALPLAAVIEGSRLTRRDWTGALAVVAGLSIFLVIARPASGAPEISGTAWIVLTGVTSVLVGGLVLFAGPGPSRRKALLLACAGGTIYGLSAALTKATSHLFERHGAVHTLGHWEPYGLAAAGLIGMLLTQSAFQAGPLDASLPALTVIDPVVSIAIGAAAFAEGITDSPIAIAVETLGMIAMVAGILLVGRSEAEKLEDLSAHRQVQGDGGRGSGVLGHDHARVASAVGAGERPRPEAHHRDSGPQRQPDL
jgi:drug/metabolite transporter (DMT)-like permease